jgi:hypothetical protein
MLTYVRVIVCTCFRCDAQDQVDAIHEMRSVDRDRRLSAVASSHGTMQPGLGQQDIADFAIANVRFRIHECRSIELVEPNPMIDYVLVVWAIYWSSSVHRLNLFESINMREQFSKRTMRLTHARKWPLNMSGFTQFFYN